MHKRPQYHIGGGGYFADCRLGQNLGFVVDVDIVDKLLLNLHFARPLPPLTSLFAVNFVQTKLT